MPVHDPQAQGIPAEEPDTAVEIRAEVERLLHPTAALARADWLPFPAGPMVPSIQCTNPPLLNAHLSACSRAYLAKKEAFPGPQIDLFRIAIRTWNDLHPSLEVRHPQSMYLAWCDMAQTQNPAEYAPGNDYLTGLRRKEERSTLERIDTAQRRHDGRATSVKKTHRLPNPYQRNLYTGTCLQQGRQPHDAGGNPGEVGESETVIDFDRNAFKTHLRWACLQRFFFKQLHSHHGYIMGKTKTNQRYHRAALGILGRLADEAQDHALGRAASGLTHPDLVPIVEDKASFHQWNEALATTIMKTASNSGPNVLWPEAFRPSSVGHPAINLQRACEIWQRLGYGCEEINTVHRLAHEVACLMTDPWACNHLDWTSDDLSKLASAVHEARIKNKNATSADPKVDATDRIDRAWGSALVFCCYTRWAGPAWPDLLQAVKEIPSP